MTTKSKFYLIVTIFAVSSTAFSFLPVLQPKAQPVTGGRAPAILEMGIGLFQSPMKRNAAGTIVEDVNQVAGLPKIYMTSVIMVVGALTMGAALMLGVFLSVLKMRLTAYKQVSGNPCKLSGLTLYPKG